MSIEALKQAVDFAEYCLAELDLSYMASNQANRLIEKSRQAIAQAEKREALERKTEDHDVDCLCSDCSALDDLDDEVLGFNGWGYPIEKPEAEKQDENLCLVCKGGSCTAEHGCVALDNPPPQRQPLTDEQIADMRAKRYWLTAKDRAPYLAGIRDAEAAHGIKGEA